MIQNTKFQKARCLTMAEHIHCLLCALLALCLYSGNIGSPQMLDHIGQFAETLQKFHGCLREQNELGKFKRLFKQSEITSQLDVCERELKAASDIFITQYGVGVASALVEMGLDTERRHQDLLELISTRSTTLTTASSVRGSSFSNSSGSFSLLPASPQIFHGRDSELNDLSGALLLESPRVAVLGPGGMGKTTLAMAAIHHTAIVEKYQTRHFISCESANSCADLVSIVGSHLGLEPSRQLSKAIVHHFKESGLCFLVLDNLETPWEPVEFRTEVEEFLSLLADVPTLALMITMRGAERPGKLKWNKPFLPPLEPLSASASRQIFSEVADEPGIGEESALDELLSLSGGLPLAASLMASIASFEGYTSTMDRWKLENTALLSDGHDKRSNLEISIILSLGSPRISAFSDSKSLLSLLSILPDGITHEAILTSKVPLPNIGHCRSALVQTSLAYIDAHGSLKALSPIREHIRRVQPPALTLTKPLRTHFQHFLRVWESYQQLPSGDLAPRLVASLGNLHNLLLCGLADDPDAKIDIAHSILLLNTFSRTMLKGNSLLTKQVPNLIKETGDPQLRWSYACEYLRGRIPPIVDTDAEIFVAEGIQYFRMVQCPIDQAVHFYTAAAYYYADQKRLARATEIVDLALVIGNHTKDPSLRFEILDVKCRILQGAQEQVVKLLNEARQSGPFP
ncbi:P-loop containing nucleoside triphosphate hydrolase protein, partial [Mycena vulgaris]